MTKTLAPSIDFVIVARNEEKRIGQLLDAIANQNYPQSQINIYVVDNCSSDATAAIATKCGAHVLKSNGTVGQCRNAGVHAGSGELVCFFDAHVVPAQSWAQSMADRFDEDNVGGCMGAINDSCDDAVTQWLQKGSIFATPETIREHTIAATNSSYPWISTCNCAYRRKALQEAGGCNPNLFRCEDTDISWRVFLLGYQLVYEPAASIVHYDRSSALQYLRKHFNYGIGAAQIAHVYGLTGKRKKSDTSKSQVATKLLKLAYNAGFQYEDSAIRKNKAAALPQYICTAVKDEFRPVFKWTDAQALRMSTDVLYWCFNQDATIAVSRTNDKRYVAEGTANHIFRSLLKCRSRVDTVKMLCQIFSVDANEVEQDVDEYVQGLIEDKIFLECLES